MKSLSKSALLALSLFLLSACASGGTAAPRATIGDVGSKVTIEEFSDFQCPACGLVSPQVEEIARANPEKIRLEFRHFPLSQHENAFIAAVAAECANLQGKFWEYGKLAFQNQENLTDKKLREMAQSLGLDMASFNTCLDGSQTASRVREDMKAGTDLGVSYTPSFYVNGKLIQYTTKESFEGYLKTLE